MLRTAPSPRPHGRRQRGGALVETALMMLVLIPLILYAIFLMDAAYLKLDLQETVVSGIWDFSTRNAEAGTAAGELDTPMRAVRASYSDHTSAFEDGAEVDPDVVQDYGNTDRIRGRHMHHKHHDTYFAAQYTFRWEGADTQFLCSPGDDMGWVMDGGMFSGFGERFGSGGYVRCEATGFIYNYLIPQQLFTEFTDVQMSNLTRRQGDSHQFQGEGGNTANIVAHETAAVSFNTWALRNGAPNGGGLDDADIGVRDGAGYASNVAGPFYERVVHDYTDTPERPGTYTLMIRPGSANFTARAGSNNTVAMTAITAGATTRSVTGLPNMAGVFLVARYQPRRTQDDVRQRPPGLLGGRHEGFQSTPFRNVNNNYVTAYNNRGTGYMGCRQPERDRCN